MGSSLVTGSPVRTRRLRSLIALLAVGMLALSACTDSGPQPIRVARTATVDAGVRAIVDNCPGPEQIVFGVREEVLWSAENPNAAADAEASDAAAEAAEAAEAEEEATTENDPDTTSTPPVRPPGLLDILVGAAPEGWTTTQQLEQPLRDDIRYTLRTLPDGQEVEFAVPSLTTRTLFDGETSVAFQPESLREPCEEDADLNAFFGDLAVLGALGLTSAALVLVAIITLLFVITRRFNRVRTIERRLAQAAPAGSESGY